MICSACKTDGIRAVNEGIQVCWCGVDLCLACIEAHGSQCEWYRAMKLKPMERTKKKEPFPKIGKLSK